MSQNDLELLDDGSPRNLEHFELLEEIGRGGFARVYRARDQKLGRMVALKVLNLGGENKESLKRFQQESVVAAKLKSENVVRVFESGVSNGRHFIAFELIEGVNLREWLGFSNLSHVDICKLMRRVARGLAEAHEHGIIHRDLKPENVIVDLSGLPKVTDFGLACLLEHRITTAEVALGTVAYVNPEQARGEARHPKPTGDIFSIGLILFEALTQRLPIQAATQAEYLASLVSREIIPIREVDRSIHQDLGAIVDKCMSHSPRFRYLNGRELVDDLTRFIDGRPTKARPLTKRTRLSRFLWKHRSIAGLSAIAIVSLIATTAFAVYYAVTAGIATDQALTAAVSGIRSSKTEFLEANVLEAEPIASAIRKKLTNAVDPRTSVSEEFNLRYANLSLYGYSKADLLGILSKTEDLSDAEYSLLLNRCVEFRAADVEECLASTAFDPAKSGRLPLLSLAAGSGDIGITAAQHDANQEDRFALIDAVARLVDSTAVAISVLAKCSPEVKACVITGVAEWPTFTKPFADLSQDVPRPTSESSNQATLNGKLQKMLIAKSTAKPAYLRSAARYACVQHDLANSNWPFTESFAQITREDGSKFLALTTELTRSHLASLRSRPEIERIWGRLERAKRLPTNGDTPIVDLALDEMHMICNAFSEANGFAPVYGKDGQVNGEATGFRLPTHPEWQLATAGGSATTFFFGNNVSYIAKYAVEVTSFRGASAVLDARTRRPNAFGLFDSLGNATEPVQLENQVVVFGGNAWFNPDQCHPLNNSKFRQSRMHGMRIVRNYP